MPPYLVTLRHAETGETKQIGIHAGALDDAIMDAETVANEQEGITDPRDDVWMYDHACPADDAPVPGRDR